MAETVKLKGIKDGIMIVFSNADFEAIYEETLQKVNEVMEFFHCGSNRIVFAGATLNEADRVKLEKALLDMIESEVSIEYETEDFQEFVEQTVGARDQSVFHYGTLRSGQALKSLGNLIVVGDVNPGAELVAVGNIIVMGILRGIVHAGCNGDRTAVVCASKMLPTQIRIADIITRTPDGDVNAGWIPEMAYVKDSNIYIDNYLSKNIK